MEICYFQCLRFLATWGPYGRRVHIIYLINKLNVALLLGRYPWATWRESWTDDPQRNSNDRVFPTRLSFRPVVLNVGLAPNQWGIAKFWWSVEVGDFMNQFWWEYKIKMHLFTIKLIG